MLERRSAPRNNTNIAGSVGFGYGRDLECMVRNASDGGACLVFAYRRTALPVKFSLRVDSDSAGRACELVWRSGFRAGVRFVG
jgi:hypothetical protein